MNDLDILRNVGLKEVSRKTHIGSEYLEYIVNKDFDKLLRLNVSGYIKILQRDYNINLSEWMSEYDEYCKTHIIDNSTRTKVDPKLKSYTGDALPRRVSGGSLGWLLWVVIIFVFGIASYFFDAQKYIEQIPNIFEDKNRSTVYSNSTIVQEVKKNMNIAEQNSTFTISNKNIEQNLSIQVSLDPQPKVKPKIEPIAEQNLTKIPVVSAEETDKKQDTTSNITPKQKQDTEENNSTQADNSIGVFVAKGDKEVIITPKSNVWIGVIDLKTKEKKSATTAKDYVINLKGEKLLACGNGNIVMNINGEKKTFEPSRAARFLIKDGEIRFLTYDEFIGLNGGKSW